MKKLLLMLMLLCTSFLGAWAVDWSSISYLGDGAGGGTYTNKYKVEPVTGANVDNIQRPGWGTAAGIYIAFNDAAFGELRIDGNKIEYDVSGAGVLLHLSSFTKQESEVEVMTSDNSSVRWSFHVYYVDGSTGGGSDPDPEPQPAGPTGQPTAPKIPAANVKAIYSSTYSADCTFGEWTSGTSYTQETYGKKFVTNAYGFFGLTFAAFNCTDMKKLHIDVWPEANTTIRVVPCIEGPGDVNPQVTTTQLTANQWNSVDIDIPDEWKVSGINQFKIDNIANQTLWINNLYFYSVPAVHGPTDYAPALTSEATNALAILSKQNSVNTTVHYWTTDVTSTDETYGKKIESTGGAYFGLGNDNANKDCSETNTLSLCVWAEEDMSLMVHPCVTGQPEPGVTKSVTGGQWNVIEIPFTEYPTVENWNPLIYIKISDIANKTFWIDNVYVYSAPTPDPELEGEPTVYTSGEKTIKIYGYKKGNDYEVVVTSTDDISGGVYSSSWTLAPSGNKTVNEITIKKEEHTLVYYANSTKDPISFTPFYIQIDGEKAFGEDGKVNITWNEVSELPYPLNASVVTSVSVSAANPFVKAGETSALPVVIKDQYGRDMDAAVEYTVTPATAGTITDGEFTAAQNGQATITATSDGKSGTCDVFVYEGTNVALGSTVLSATGNNPQNAVDGDQGNYWEGISSNLTDLNQTASIVLDLGTEYNVNAASIKFEGACSAAYTLSVSTDNETWTTVETYSGPEGINGHTDFITMNQEGVRYVKFESTKSATVYSMKVHEIQVFGVDVTKPVLIDAKEPSASAASAKIKVQATDNSGKVGYNVYNGTTLLTTTDLYASGAEVDIVVRGLNPNTTYNLTIKAVDASGNESDLSKSVTVTTTDGAVYNINLNNATYEDFIAFGDKWVEQHKGATDKHGIAVGGDKDNKPTQNYQAQLFVTPADADKITYRPGYQYDINFTLRYNKTVNDAIVKLDSKNGIIIRNNLNLEADAAHLVSAGVYEKSFTISNYAYTGGETDGRIFFDFAPCAEGTEVTVENIQVVEHLPHTGYIIGSNPGETDNVTARSKYIPSDYVLAWHDEFDQAEPGHPNPNYWNIEINNDGGGNGELQAYSNNGVFVNNGNLILTATRQNYDGQEFTSGRVNTQGNVSFKYGILEARIKMPDTYKGLWPAFWAMGNDYPTSGWPACGELDIVEMGMSGGLNSPEDANSHVNGALHYGNNGHQQQAQDKIVSDFTIQDGKYHIFRCEWDENKIKCYVDDVNYFDVDNNVGNFFKHFHYYLFNLAVGSKPVDQGGYVGIPNPEGITALGYTEEDNQRSMYIDYVRVYQPADEQHILVNEDYLKDIDIKINQPGTGSIYYLIDGDSETYNALAGKEIIDLRPDGQNRNFDIWEGTFNSPESPSGIVRTLEQNSSMTWSGAAYNMVFPMDLSSIDENYTFHFRVRVAHYKENSEIKFTLFGNGSAAVSIPLDANIADGGWYDVDVPLKWLFAHGLTFENATSVSGNFLTISAGGETANKIEIANIYLYGDRDNAGYYIRHDQGANPALIERNSLTNGKLTFTLYNKNGGTVTPRSWKAIPAGNGTWAGSTYSATHAVPVVVTATTVDGYVIHSNLDVAPQNAVISHSSTRGELNAGEYYVVNMGNIAFETIKDKAVDMRTVEVQQPEEGNERWDGNHLYVWENTFADNATDSKKISDIAGGTEAILNYKVADGVSWSGMGFNYKTYDMSKVNDNYYLHIELASKDDHDIKVTLNGEGGAASVTLNPYKTNEADGKTDADLADWVAYDIPMSIFMNQGMYFDETTDGNIVVLNGAGTPGKEITIGAMYFFGTPDVVDPIPDVVLGVTDITNTTAVVNIPKQSADTEVTVTYNWIDPKSGTSVSHTHSSTTIAGQPYYMPIFNLEPNTAQSVTVKVGNSSPVELPFQTLIHQSIENEDVPANARGELVKDEPIPFVDYEPYKDGLWTYRDVANYQGKDSEGVYRFTLPVATSDAWQAQFRKNLGYIDTDQDGVNDQVVSLYDEYDYDLSFTVNSNQVVPLRVSIESTETAWRDHDGQTSIIKDFHGNITAEELASGGYKYTVKNYPGKDIPGAVLVVDFGGNPAETNVEISNISVVEKPKSSAPIVVDGIVYIKNANELKEFEKNVSSTDPADAFYKNATAYLLADVNTANITGDDTTFKGIGTDAYPFTGKFITGNAVYDADGVTIIGVMPAEHTVTLTDTNTGLFNVVDGAQINGVTVKGSINGGDKNNIGGLVNVSNGDTKITNCHNEANITTTGYNVGGIIGYVTDAEHAEIIIDYAVNKGNINGEAKVGGIIGRVEKAGEGNPGFEDFNIYMTDVLNEGTITAATTDVADANAAGLIGCATNSHITAVNVGNAGAVTGGENQNAAFVGWIDGKASFKNSYNSGVISNAESGKNLYRILPKYDDDEHVKLIHVFDVTSNNSGQGATTISKADDGSLKAELKDAAYEPVKKAHDNTADALPWVQTLGADAHPVFVAGKKNDPEIETVPIPHAPIPSATVVTVGFSDSFVDISKNRDILDEYYPNGNYWLHKEKEIEVDGHLVKIDERKTIVDHPMDEIDGSDDQVMHLTNFGQQWYDFNPNLSDALSTEMNYFHIDIYPVTDVEKITFEWNYNTKHMLEFELEQGKWNSIDIPVSQFKESVTDPTNPLNNFCNFAIKGAGNVADPDGYHELYIDNIYLWSNPEELTYVDTNKPYWISPSEPTGTATNVTYTNVTLPVEASDKHNGIVEGGVTFKVYDEDEQLVMTQRAPSDVATDLIISGLEPKTTYTFTVEVWDDAGNKADDDKTFNVTTSERTQDLVNGNYLYLQAEGDAKLYKDIDSDGKKELISENMSLNYGFRYNSDKSITVTYNTLGQYVDDAVDFQPQVLGIEGARVMTKQVDGTWATTFMGREYELEEEIPFQIYVASAGQNAMGILGSYVYVVGTENTVKLQGLPEPLTLTARAINSAGYWATFSRVDKDIFMIADNKNKFGETCSYSDKYDVVTDPTMYDSREGVYAVMELSKGHDLRLKKFNYRYEKINNVEVQGYYIPKNTGVLIFSKEKVNNNDDFATKKYYIKEEPLSPVISERNRLYPSPATGAVGSKVQIDSDEEHPDNYEYFKLGYSDMANHKGLKFYWGAADGVRFNMNAGAAYMKVKVKELDDNDEEDAKSKIAGFSLFEFIDDEEDNIVTLIDMVSASDINWNKPVYNISGQRVSRSAKGVLIQDGKKYVVK